MEHLLQVVTWGLERNYGNWRNEKWLTMEVKNGKEEGREMTLTCYSPAVGEGAKYSVEQPPPELASGQHALPNLRNKPSRRDKAPAVFERTLNPKDDDELSHRTELKAVHIGT